MKEKKRLRRGIIAACVIVALTALGFSLAALYIRAPEIGEPDLRDGGSPEPDDGTPGTGGKAYTPPKTGLSAGKKRLPQGDEPEPVKGDRRAGVYTILLIGTSDDYSSDTLMVAAVDTAKKTIGVVSIPRDTKVQAVRQLKKINGALGYGGVSLVRKEVAGILGFKPDFTVKIGLKGLINLVDAIGGVDYDIPYEMSYDDPAQDLHIHFKPGPQHLDGQSAMEMVRYRGHAGSDLSRMELQQNFLSAVAKKVLSPANITKIDKFAKIYAENVDTDLTVGNLIWFGIRGYEIGTENIRMETLPTYTEDAAVNPSYYQFVSSKEAIKLINETVNPYKEEITAGNVVHLQFEAPVKETLEEGAEVIEGVTVVHVDGSGGDSGDSGGDENKAETGSEEPDSGDASGDETDQGTGEAG